ncbi:MAG: tetratricopeptide repeat protein [SAR324 cluster bacterium]|nr:tetratricopeptide repeat protein [SAR324 cluster bacterium]MCZ6627845.1 tetratricopeptide repeat protein [SAR324 cluster bacterium]
MTNLRPAIVFLILFFTMQGLIFIATTGTPSAAELEEQGKLQSLLAGSPGERKQALNWLARYGRQTAVPPVADRLLDDNPGVRELAESTLWAIWSRSGSVRVDEMLKFGSYLMANGRVRQAVSIFDEVISDRPDFAEGYNKRATAWYLLGRYQHSLDDIARTLEQNPYHFGALSGAGYCMIKLERMSEAVDYLKRALKINPNLESVRKLARSIERELSKKSI